MHPYHLIMNKIVKCNFAITTTEDIVSKINDASKQFFVIENNKPYGAVRGKRKMMFTMLPVLPSSQIARSKLPLNI